MKTTNIILWLLVAIIAAINVYYYVADVKVTKEEAIASVVLLNTIWLAYAIYNKFNK